MEIRGWRFAERPRLRPSIIGDLAALATARDYPVMRSTRQRSDRPGMPDTRRWSSAATIAATVTESGDVTASYVTRSPLVRPKPLPQTVGGPRPALPNGHCEGLPTRPHIAMPLTVLSRTDKRPEPAGPKVFQVVGCKLDHGIRLCELAPEGRKHCGACLDDAKRGKGIDPHQPWVPLGRGPSAKHLARA